MKYQLKVIIASTRPSRKGHLVANWFVELLKQHTDYEVEVLDLKEINLPMMDEAEHPRFKNYKNEHTIEWSKTIDGADAFIVVTPEYNYSYPASIKNALDYLSKEWMEKPWGFVSYGGVSAGTRSVQEMKLPLTTFNIMPIAQAVNIPFFNQFINEDGVFEGNELLEKSAHTMVSELLRWTEALKGMREKTKNK